MGTCVPAVYLCVNKTLTNKTGCHTVVLAVTAGKTYKVETVELISLYDYNLMNNSHFLLYSLKCCMRA